MRPSVSFAPAIPTSPAVPAPAPAAVARAAAADGAQWVLVRPSSRSFSGWVAVCLFPTLAAAGEFAKGAARSLNLQFCLVRPRGRWFGVSVPVAVSVVPAVPVGSLPCQWFNLGGGGGASAPVPAPGGSPVPAVVTAALASAPAVAFSGSRSVVPAVVPAVVACASPGVPVLVGCARGVDRAVRELVPTAKVFTATAGGRGAIAARSIALVRAIAAAGGVLVSFPASACPVGLAPSLSPSRAFCGLGSGSWASLAFAVGLGVPVLVCLPAGVLPPVWGFVAIGSNWWSLSPPGQFLLF